PFVLSHTHFFFFSLLPPLSLSILFPYTTLFRSSKLPVSSFLYLAIKGIVFPSSSNSITFSIFLGLYFNSALVNFKTFLSIDTFLSHNKKVRLVLELTYLLKNIYFQNVSYTLIGI